VPQIPALAFSCAIVCKLGVFETGVVLFLIPELAWFQILPNASLPGFLGCVDDTEDNGEDFEPVLFADTETEVK
jgi:hypothetical protein